jgi:hypothetical protein
MGAWWATKKIFASRHQLLAFRPFYSMHKLLRNGADFVKLACLGQVAWA